MPRDKKVNVKIKVDDKTATPKLKGFMGSLLSIKSLIASGIGFFTLKKGLDATVGAAARAETQLKKLAVAMKSAGRFSKDNIEAFRELAVDLERQTGFLEEDVLQSLAILQTFGRMSREDMEKTIVAALNMATVFGEDLVQASIRLGKAYVGQLAGLQRVGVSIDNATFKAEGFNAVLKQLAIEQGGQAQARLEGFEGAAKNVGVEFENLTKEVGRNIAQNEDLIESLRVASGALKQVTDFIISKRTQEAASFDEIERYIHLTDAQRKALVGLANSNVVIAFQKELNNLVKEEVAIREKLNDLAQGGGFGFRGNIVQQQLDLEQDLERTLEKTAELRRKINNLMQDPNIVTEIKRQISATGELKDETVRLTAAEIKVAEERKKAAEEAFKESVQRTANLIRERIAQAKEERERLKQINEEKLNDALSVIAREAEARDRLTRSIVDIQKRRLSEALKDETLNESERGLVIDEVNEKADSLFQTLTSGNINSAIELEKLIEKYKSLNDTIAGTRGTEEAAETLKSVALEIESLITTLGRAKIAPDFDIEAIRKSSRTAAEVAADEYAKTFQNNLNTKSFTVNVKAKTTFNEL